MNHTRSPLLSRDAGADPFIQRWRFVAGCYLFAAGLLWSLSYCFLSAGGLADRRGTPLGGDFVMFYAAGEAVLMSEQETLYDDARNQRRTSALIPGLPLDQSWPYRYPPCVAQVMAPFARFPYPIAFALFTTGSWLCLVGSVQLLWRWLGALSTVREKPPLNGRTLGLICLAWPVTLETLLGGQLSCVALLLVVASLDALRKDRPLRAGLMLGLSIYKPNVLAWFILGAAVRYPRLLLGACLSGIGVVTISSLGFGLEPWLDYAQLGARLATQNWAIETPYWKVQGLVPVFAALFGTHARQFVLGVGACLALGLGCMWRRAPRESTPVWIASLLLVNTFFNPYPPIYDLMLLLPAAAMYWWTRMGTRCDPSPRATERWSSHDVLWGLFFFGPHLSQSLARGIGWQVFPVLVCGIWLFGSACYADVPSRDRKSRPQPAWPKAIIRWAHTFFIASRAGVR